jgi:hypothetical protein
MAQRNQESVSEEPLEDIFEPVIGDLSDDDFEPLTQASTEKQRLAEKRRRAEQRLEEKRLREELGYYDLELDDF